MTENGLARLAAKQKRRQDWLKFAEREVQDPVLRDHMKSLIRGYSALLAEWWDKRKADTTLEGEIADLERELDQYMEEGRLRVVPRWRQPDRS